MKEKDRIIIPTGTEPEEELETPQFDAEETLLAARPVVPLTEKAIRSARGTATPLNKRFPLLALIIIAAVSVGLASGLAIGLYRGREKTNATVTTQPSSTTTADTRLKGKPADAEETGQTPLPSIQTVADTGKTTETPLQADNDKVAEKNAEAPATDTEVSDEGTPERTAPKRDKKRSDDDPFTQPVSRKVAEYNPTDDDINKKRQKAAKRREREMDDERGTRPRTVERASQELNRIREIFEGQQP